jgi:hypothetical protein
MHGNVRTLLIAVVVGAFFAVPASAGAVPPQHFRFALDPVTVVHQPCGAVEVIDTTIWGSEFFDSARASIAIHVHFDYEGTITFGDRSVRDDAHQNAILRPSGINTLNGQGISFHLPGRGLVFQDIGHLVFSDLTGLTISGSAKVIGFDHPNAPDFSEAVCEALG